MVSEYRPLKSALRQAHLAYFIPVDLHRFDSISRGHAKKEFFRQDEIDLPRYTVIIRFPGADLTNAFRTLRKFHQPNRVAVMTITEGTIPSWNSIGVLPPIRPLQKGHSPDRSPYIADLLTVVDRFAISEERVKILRGLLQFRSKMHLAGITSGFQWIDGSFLENVEITKGRPPRDMDVVTFFHLPEGESQASLVYKFETLFDQEALKGKYFVDSYPVVLGDPMDSLKVKIISYWYSMWSHRRDGLWKGFVQVDLDPTQDIDACAILDSDGGMTYE